MPEEALIAELQSWQQLRSQTSSELRAMAMQPQFCVPFLQLGRLVFISDPTHSSAADRCSPSAYLHTHTPRQHSVAWLCGSSGQPHPFGWGAIRRVVRGTVAATLSQQLPVIGAQEGLQDLAVELFLEVSSSSFQRGGGCADA